MGTSYDDFEGRLADALRAIIARINGIYDAPELKAIGPLSVDSDEDVLRIAEDALTDAGEPIPR